jgi:hypothetical protein
MAIAGVPSEVGHFRPKWALRFMSSLPPTATEEPTFRFGSFVPGTEVISSCDLNYLQYRLRKPVGDACQNSAKHSKRRLMSARKPLEDLCHHSQQP